MRKGHLIGTCTLALVLSACGGTSAPEHVETQAPAAAATPPVEETDSASVAAAAEDAAFTLDSVPVSEVALGEFPYLRLPDGYVYTDRADSDYDRVAFWTGDRLEWVEGRVFGARVLGDGDQGKTFVLLEYQRNMQAAIQQAGGQRIVEGQWPRELRDELAKADPDLGVRYNGGLGDIWNRPVETFVIRRADRAIWIQVTGYQHGGSLLVAETAAVEITSGLLEAEALKRQLDADGRVAIQVNFAVDEADILPDSQPQIEQVLALLQADPSLQISIEGHTDDTGTADHNRALSQSRARSVAAALTGRGVDAARLTATGFGQDNPVADNDTAAGKAKNRRVELVKR